MFTVYSFFFDEFCFSHDDDFLVVARYLIGLLHSRSPSFFDTHKPISFSTLSSPVSPSRDPIVHKYFYNTGG